MVKAKTNAQMTPAMVFQIVCDMADKKAEPDDVKRLLQFFCKTIEKKKPTPPVLVRFIRESFRRYLSGKADSLDHAFGLVRGRAGKPVARDSQEAIEMAASVLRYRLDGKHHNRAVEETVRVLKCGKTTVADAWRENRHAAFVTVRNERPAKPYPWSDEEESVLLKIYPLDARILDLSERINRGIRRT